MRGSESPPVAVLGSKYLIPASRGPTSGSEWSPRSTVGIESVEDEKVSVEIWNAGGLLAGQIGRSCICCGRSDMVNFFRIASKRCWGDFAEVDEIKLHSVLRYLVKVAGLTDDWCSNANRNGSSPQNVLETFLLSYLSANCGCCRSSKRRVDVPDVVVDDRDGVSLLSRLRKHKCWVASRTVETVLRQSVVRLLTSLKIKQYSELTYVWMITNFQLKQYSELTYVCSNWTYLCVISKNYLKNDCFLRKLLNEVEVLLESAAGRHVMDASL